MSHLTGNRHHDLPGERRTLEHAQQMAGHESPRTTKLYDRTKDEITLSEWSESGCNVRSLDLKPRPPTRNPLLHPSPHPLLRCLSRHKFRVSKRWKIQSRNSQIILQFTSSMYIAQRYTIHNDGAELSVSRLTESPRPLRADHRIPASKKR